MSQLRNEVRVEDTRRELDALRAEIAAWADQRAKLDAVGQYATQLRRIARSLSAAVEALTQALADVSTAGRPGAVATRCGAVEDAAMLVRRVWTYFTTKWAQRDDPQYSATLAAAEEIVWSCHAEPMRAAARATGSEAAFVAPLPFIDSAATPSAIPRQVPPPAISAAQDDELVGQYLHKLAVPVIALPPACARDPWWLVLIAHEVGHHLQFDIVDDWAVVAGFGTLLETEVADEAAGEWRRWSQEVFADACAVCATGLAAVQSIALVELAGGAAALSPLRARYPPAPVRVAMLEAQCRVLGVCREGSNQDADVTTLLAEAKAASAEGRHPTAEPDLDHVEKVVSATHSWQLPGSGLTLPQLFGWDRSSETPDAFRRSQGAWTKALLGEARLPPSRRVDVPRRLAAAAFAAWRRVAAIGDAARREHERARLRERILDILPKCREEGTRAAARAAREGAEDLGREFAHAAVLALPSRA